MRMVIGIAALAFLLAFAALTALDIVHNGFSVLSVPSILILALIGVGVIGALTHPPRE